MENKDIWIIIWLKLKKKRKKRNRVKKNFFLIFLLSVIKTEITGVFDKEKKNLIFERKKREKEKKKQKGSMSKKWKKKNIEKKIKKKCIIPVITYENNISSEKNKKKWRMQFLLIFLWSVFFWSFHLQSMSLAPMFHQTKHTPQKN